MKNVSGDAARQGRTRGRGDRAAGARLIGRNDALNAKPPVPQHSRHGRFILPG